MGLPLRRKIARSGNSAALLLSQDLLGMMGVAAGDEVEVQLLDRTLVVRPVGEAARARRVADAVDDVIARRKRLMGRLAEGPGRGKRR
jgi:antitoxin component of MazEF toxin-antitoxin module